MKIVFCCILLLSLSISSLFASPRGTPVQSSKEEIKEVVDTLSMVMWYLNICRPHELFGIPKKKDVEKVKEVLEKWKAKLKSTQE